MTTQDQPLLNRIVIHRDTLHGKPHIAGTRVLVYQVLDLLAAGKIPAEITGEDYFPDIQPGDVLACIAFASQLVRDDAVVTAV